MRLNGVKKHVDFYLTRRSPEKPTSGASAGQMEPSPSGGKTLKREGRQVLSESGTDKPSSLGASPLAPTPQVADSYARQAGLRFEQRGFILLRFTSYAAQDLRQVHQSNGHGMAVADVLASPHPEGIETFFESACPAKPHGEDGFVPIRKKSLVFFAVLFVLE